MARGLLVDAVLLHVLHLIDPFGGLLLIHLRLFLFLLLSWNVGVWHLGNFLETSQTKVDLVDLVGLVVVVSDHFVGGCELSLVLGSLVSGILSKDAIVHVLAFLDVLGVILLLQEVVDLGHVVVVVCVDRLGGQLL